MTKKLALKLKTLPKAPGVYLFKDQTGRILYIGKATNIKNRVRSHFSNGSDILKGKFLKSTRDIDWMETDDEKQAFILENDLIKKYKPRYNIQWRDDKSYLWVTIAKEEWPRIKIAHQTELLRSEKYQTGTKIGPFTNGTELRSVLRALRRIFPYRTCKNPYSKPCLQWHLGLCPAHSSESPKVKSKSQKNPPHQTSPEGKSSSSPLGGVRGDFEKAQKQYFNSLSALRQFLRLYAGEPIRIESYDVSNIHGNWATGSMIVFRGNKPDKKNYRRFKIKTVQGANDIAMMKEVLRRRLKHPEWTYPDIILIDGGIAQLNAALAIIGNHWPNTAIISLAKKEEEIYTEYSNKSLRIRSLPLDLRLIFQAIRNEAHRFAIFYYRHLHRKQFKTPNSHSTLSPRAHPSESKTKFKTKALRIKT